MILPADSFGKSQKEAESSNSVVLKTYYRKNVNGGLFLTLV